MHRFETIGACRFKNVYIELCECADSYNVYFNNYNMRDLQMQVFSFNDRMKAQCFYDGLTNAFSLLE